MAYVAFLDQNNIVTRVVQSPDDLTDWCSVWASRYNCKCVCTSKTGEFGHQYAAPGYTYHADIDAFIEPSPYPSWVLNKSIPAWEAPVPMPDDEDGDLVFDWDESRENWVIIYDVAINGPIDCIDC